MKYYLIIYSCEGEELGKTYTLALSGEFFDFAKFRENALSLNKIERTSDKIIIVNIISLKEEEFKSYSNFLTKNF